MDNDLVEEIARRLAELETSRPVPDGRDRLRVVALITERHRKKARLALQVINFYRKESNKA
jgi:hypothetical protein